MDRRQRRQLAIGGAVVAGLAGVAGLAWAARRGDAAEGELLGSEEGGLIVGPHPALVLKGVAKPAQVGGGPTVQQIVEMIWSVGAGYDDPYRQQLKDLAAAANKADLAELTKKARLWDLWWRMAADGVVVAGMPGGRAAQVVEQLAAALAWELVYAPVRLGQQGTPTAGQATSTTSAPAPLWQRVICLQDKVQRFVNRAPIGFQNLSPTAQKIRNAMAEAFKLRGSQLLTYKEPAAERMYARVLEQGPGYRQGYFSVVGGDQAALAVDTSKAILLAYQRLVLLTVQAEEYGWEDMMGAFAKGVSIGIALMA
ncbi:MAG: hypothetical protein Q8Q14_05275 [Gemmatimonadales bacterium]|nr:hypothetical protein [Gemmatimonadales bacterium]